MRLVLLVWLLAGALPAAAATVPVRTAEHPDFTRIVVDFVDRPEWRLDRDPDVARMVTTRPTSFDLSNVYRRIGKSRVERLWQDEDGALAIALACDCEIETFELPNQGLVLDVRQRPATAASDRAAPALDWTKVRPRAEPILPGLLQSATAPGTEADARRRRVGETRAEVSRMLARGAAQGLVETAGPTLDIDPPPDPAPVVIVEPAPAPVEEELATLYPNIRIETQIDRDSTGGSPVPGQTSCMDPALSAIEDWGTPALFADGLSLDRTGLVNEAGDPDRAAHLALVRTYLYLTFGAEAAEVLRTGPAGLPGAALLADMAAIIDGPAEAPVLARQSGCDSAAGVLALLTDGAEMPGDLRPVLSRFTAFPRHLRQHVGPRLAAALLDAGDADGALLVRNALNRAAGEGGAEPTMLSARLEIDAGRPDEAAPDLLDIVRQRSPDAAEALLLLLETREGQEREVERGILEQALALSFEAAPGTGEDLRLAVARSLIVQNDFETAVEIIRSASDGPGRSRAAALLFETIAALEDDAEFLTHAVKYSADAPVDTGLRLRIAERLAANQLFGPARVYLETGDAIPTRAERILRAEITAAEGKPRISESYIAGLEGEDVEPIRRRIATMDDAEPTAPADAAFEVDEAPDGPDISRKGREMIERSAALREELSGLLDE